MTRHSAKPWKATLLAGLWVWAVAYAGYLGVLFWTDPGMLLYAGHAVSLVFFGVPLLLLVAMSWPLLRIWTRRPQRMPVIFLVVWVGTILVPPPPLPTSRWTRGMAEAETTVHWSFLVFAVLVSVMPLLLSLGMLRATIRARGQMSEELP